MYSVTNSHEGLQFINPATTDLKTYIANLYPKLTNAQITAAALIYAQQGSTVIDQAAAVIGEGTTSILSSLILKLIGNVSHVHLPNLSPASGLQRL